MVLDGAMTQVFDDETLYRDVTEACPDDPMAAVNVLRAEVSILRAEVKALKTLCAILTGEVNSPTRRLTDG